MASEQLYKENQLKTLLEWKSNPSNWQSFKLLGIRNTIKKRNKIKEVI